jgi:hypothetical protein
MVGTADSSWWVKGRHFSGNDRAPANKWDNGRLFTNAVFSWQFNGFPAT